MGKKTSSTLYYWDRAGRGRRNPVGEKLLRGVLPDACRAGRCASPRRLRRRRLGGRRVCLCSLRPSRERRSCAVLIFRDPSGSLAARERARPRPWHRWRVLECGGAVTPFSSTSAAAADARDQVHVCKKSQKIALLEHYNFAGVA
jgi:hypothetical protein